MRGGHAFFIFFCLIISSSVLAHERHDPEYPQGRVIPATVERNIVEITEDQNFRYIKSNGIPMHRTGNFPNSGNPNSISAQSHSYRIALKPKKTGEASAKDGVIGVALNGIPFEPSTAECFGRSRGSRGPLQFCEWKEEAIINGVGQLGLDNSNAHVQPNGTYHYHGMPYGLLNVLGAGDLLHAGYAADGFNIMVSRSGAYKPSYRLKKGTRPNGPGGKYDGTYTADFSYAAAKVGDLDECNGAYVDALKGYAYFITEGFPFLPRCLMGKADPSFERRKNGQSTDPRPHPMHNGGNHPRPPHPPKHF